MNKAIKIKNCSGLTSVIGYEPWAERAIDSAKQSLSDGVPILIRLHPGADYPCDNLSTFYKQDMEGHAVLLIGYDDSTRMFDAVDPWNGKGEFGGIIKLPYEIMPLRCVNATADKATRVTPPEISVTIICDKNGKRKHLKISAGYYIPLGYIIDRKENTLSDFHFEISYNNKGNFYHLKQELNGNFSVDNKAELLLPLSDAIEGVVDFDICFSCVVRGERPYPYEDRLNMEFSQRVVVFDSFNSEIQLLRFKLVA